MMCFQLFDVIWSIGDRLMKPFPKTKQTSISKHTHTHTFVVIDVTDPCPIYLKYPKFKINCMNGKLFLSFWWYNSIQIPCSGRESEIHLLLFFFYNSIKVNSWKKCFFVIVINIKLCHRCSFLITKKKS